MELTQDNRQYIINNLKEYLNVKTERGGRFKEALEIIESAKDFCFHISSDHLFMTRRNNDFRKKYSFYRRFINNCSSAHAYYFYLLFNKRS